MFLLKTYLVDPRQMSLISKAGTSYDLPQGGNSTCKDPNTQISEEYFLTMTVNNQY